MSTANLSITAPESRFSDRVENYVKYRPGYPREMIEYISVKAGLNPQKAIADMGSGTGISARYFLQGNYTVFGVEPNSNMRQAAEKYLQAYPLFKSVEGTADHTNLPGNSIDLIICAQAFHWFNKPETKTEFQRIAKENAYLALIWNDRKANEPLQQAYEKVIQDFSIDYNEVTHRNITTEAIESFFQPFEVEKKTFYYAQQFDWEGFLGRVVSSSYMPGENHPDYPHMKQALADIYQRFNREGILTFAYDTNLFIGRIR